MIRNAWGVVLALGGVAVAGECPATARASNPLRHVAATEANDIVETAVHAGSFKTLVAAVQAAGLVDTLKGAGPFTVFAPTDEAFAKLPEGTIANLLKPENKPTLRAVLTYHVVPGRVEAKDVMTLTFAGTVQGQRVDIKAANGKVMVDNAAVTATDISCSNGVIHVIDTVLLPATDAIPATAAKAKKFNTLLAAVKAAGLAETLAGDGPFTVFAPTDEAFAKLPHGTVESLLKPENKGKLVDILKYHVVAGRVYSDQALKAGKAKTLHGGSIAITTTGDAAMVNHAKLLSVDVEASNGVIHVIDAVLLPKQDTQTSGVSPSTMIEHAVARGSQMFNRGDHHGCADLYAKTTRMLLEREETMTPVVMTALKRAMDSSERTSCPTTKAWTLRRGLDAAYHHLGSVAQR